MKPLDCAATVVMECLPLPKRINRIGNSEFRRRRRRRNTIVSISTVVEYFSQTDVTLLTTLPTAHGRAEQTLVVVCENSKEQKKKKKKGAERRRPSRGRRCSVCKWLLNGSKVLFISPSPLFFCVKQTTFATTTT